MTPNAKQIWLRWALLLSLVVNGLLWWKLQLPPEPASPAGFSSMPVSRPREPMEAAASIGRGWEQVNAAAALPDQIAALRQAGVAEEIVTCIVLAQVEMQFARRKAEIFYPEKTPFWKMGAAHHSQLKPILDEEASLAKELLGESVANPVDLHAMENQLRYARIDPEKVQSIQAIESDYGAVREMLEKGRPDARVTQYLLMDAERTKDLQALLSPEELAEYERRNSPASVNLGRELRDQAVSEQDFDRLLQARTAYERTRLEAAAAGATTGPDMEARKAAMLSSYQEIMGDEVFTGYLRNNSTEYRLAEELLAGAPGTGAAALRVWTIQSEFTRMISKLQNGSAALRDAEIQRIRAETGLRLADIMGAEKARRYMDSVWPHP